MIRLWLCCVWRFMARLFIAPFSMLPQVRLKKIHDISLTLNVIVNSPSRSYSKVVSCQFDHHKIIIRYLFGLRAPKWSSQMPFLNNILSQEMRSEKLRSFGYVRYIVLFISRQHKVKVIHQLHKYCEWFRATLTTSITLKTDTIRRALELLHLHDQSRQDLTNK